MSMELNACDKLEIALSLLTEKQMRKYEKAIDCSCPECGTSDFDGYCPNCKHKGNPEDGVNWYT